MFARVTGSTGCRQIIPIACSIPRDWDYVINLNGLRPTVDTRISPQNFSVCDRKRVSP